jgi:hypothetical protein
VRRVSRRIAVPTVNVTAIEQRSEPDGEPSRAHFLPCPEALLLDNACLLINEAFGERGYGCYLVGSALKRREFRDVDVRYIMKDDEFDALFTSSPGVNALWSLVCSSVSLLLQRQSGLPVDFQIQRMTDANKKYPGGRHALGVFVAPELRAEQGEAGEAK